MQEIRKGIAGLLELIGGRKFLLVHGHSYEKLPLKEMLDPLPHVEFTEFTPNPCYEQIVEGLKVFQENDCEMLIAVGGGSAIDVTKGIKLFSNLDPAENYLKQEPIGSEIPFIAIPTTAGTGAESTKNGVLYLNGEKQGIAHDSILPDVAILDGSLLRDLPVYQKKCTMADAFAQSLEAWWSVNANEESIGYSRESIELIVNNWEAYMNPDSPEYEAAADAILLAANLSGRAIFITKTTAPHAMGYKLTTLYGMPHGNAVAIALAEVWMYLKAQAALPAVDGKSKEELENLGRLRQVLANLPVDLDWYQDWIGKLELVYPTKEQVERDIEELTASVNPLRLKNHLVPVGSEEIRMFYQALGR